MPQPRAILSLSLNPELVGLACGWVGVLAGEFFAAGVLVGVESGGTLVVVGGGDGLGVVTGLKVLVLVGASVIVTPLDT